MTADIWIDNILSRMCVVNGEWKPLNAFRKNDYPLCDYREFVCRECDFEWFLEGGEWTEDEKMLYWLEQLDVKDCNACEYLPLSYFHNGDDTCRKCRHDIGIWTGENRSELRSLWEKMLPTGYNRRIDGNRALEFFDYKCPYCLEPYGSKDIHHDHVIPKAYMENDNPGTIKENMLPCCKYCNSSKGKKNLTEWLELKFGAEHAVKALATITVYFKSL